jgi:PDDEXK-like domain of unknown function (DUF3799)
MDEGSIELGKPLILTNEQYHKAPGLSSSGLRLLLTSPYKYWDKVLNPNAPKPAETKKHFTVGTAAHTAVLEPERFNESIIVLPEDFNGRLKKHKEEREQLIQQNPQKDLLTHAEYLDIVAMQKTAHANQAAQKVLGNGQAEISIFWRDEETGVLCKCRPDYLREDFIVDYKTTDDGSRDGFQRSSYRYGYHIQDAWYSEGVRSLHGRDLPFVFLAQEKTRPYSLGLYSLDAKSKRVGAAKCRLGMRLYADCASRDYWPGYPEKVVSISLPGYAFKEEENAKS